MAMRGVTAIELLVAVAVVGLLLAVAAPALSGLVERQHVRGAGDTLASDLRLARSELQRRGAAANPMVLSFGGNADMTCYTLHTALGAPGGAALPFVCDCTRTPGTVCMPLGVRQELKTVQMRRATGVALAASSGSAGALMFMPPNGEALPPDMRLVLQGTHGASLRLSPGVAGSVVQCSPEGTMAGVPPC
jgi:type IV fimbrial biogenesis protein FimT